MAIRRIAFCAVLIASCLSPALAQDEPTLITVTNGGNAINGDTSSIAALNASPGSDGISFAEAVEAANGTAGPKILTFAPELSRTPIELLPPGVDRRPIVLTSGGLTIDGDVDDDGKPDITLVGNSAASLASFIIRSSRNTIRGLNLVTFPGPFILFTCLDMACEERGIRSTRIENNTFFAPRDAGISIARLGLRPADTPYVTDVMFDDLVISGNEFTVRDTAISFLAAYGGLQHVTARNVTITNNIIRAALGIEIVAGARSAQPYYSDFNSIENVTIEGNTFQDCGTAISMTAGDWSGSDNALRHVRIRGNEMTNTKNGLRIVAAADGIPQRSGARNVIDDVSIASNRMAVEESAVVLAAGGAPAVDAIAVGYSSNKVTNVAIEQNVISNFTGTAIRIWSGYAAAGPFGASVTDNSVAGVRIADNELQARELAHAPVDIGLTGGEAVAGTVRRNSISDVTIAGNRSTGPGTFLQLIGGSGSSARENSVEFPRLSGNTWQSAVPLTTAQNVNGATSNTIGGIFRRRAAGRK